MFVSLLCYKVNLIPVFVPFSVLRLHGFSKFLWTTGQDALVIQVLAKSSAVPSLRPLTVVKSSSCMLLKLPHKPAAGEIRPSVSDRIHQAVFIRWGCTTHYTHTACLSLEDWIQDDINLHDGDQLDLQTEF